MKLSVIEGSLSIVDGEQVEGKESYLFALVVLLLIGGASVFVALRFTIAHTL
jgi:hypothetical protein